MSQINTSYLDAIHGVLKGNENIDCWFGLGAMFVQQVNACFAKATKFSMK